MQSFNINGVLVVAASLQEALMMTAQFININNGLGMVS
jgi:hypothetical protein